MKKRSFVERCQIAERLYQVLVNVFMTEDFTLWDEYLAGERDLYPGYSENPPLFKEVKKYTDWILTKSILLSERSTPKFEPYYQDVLPAYCKAFKSYLGFRLSTCVPVEVWPILDDKLPDADFIDCKYLEDILGEIKIDLGRGFGYDPGQLGGIDRFYPVDEAIYTNLESAYRWLKYANKNADEKLTPQRTEAIKIIFNSYYNMKSDNVSERIKIANKKYTEIAKLFKGRDYLKWKSNKVTPEGEEVPVGYDEYIPPYSRRYGSMLGFTFSCVNPSDVAEVLDNHFKDADLIDTDYLEDTLEYILSIVASDYSFSTSSGDGIDYYNGHENEMQMMDASMNGIDVSNKYDFKIKSNVERARKWILRIRERIAISPKSNEKPVESNQPTTSPPAPIASEVPPRELPVLVWTGVVADLAEALYRLARAGLLDLAAHRKPGGNMLGVCRHICQLFQVPPKAQAGAVKSLNAYLSKFSAAQLAPGPVDEAVLSKAIGRKPTSRGTQHLNTMLGDLRPTNEAEPDLG